MDQANQLQSLKQRAESNALKRLHDQFSTYDQLEQIEQHMNKNEKRKNNIENQLKSAIQSHFISVDSCMEQLKDVNKSLTEVRTTIYSIQEEYKTIAHLEETLGELRREANKHKQLKSAKENVKNILNVEDLASQARGHIDANKLLNAHKCLLDMEKCRNDILEELGSPSEKNVNHGDIKLVDDFFKQVKEIQLALHNHIFMTIKRMLEVSKSYPEQLVSALRIIEREEILDDYWQKKKEDENGFAPKDRPKKWRQECRDTIKTIVENKVHGLRIEERDTDDSWFSKHLGNVCARIVPDLEIVKRLCEPCFPADFKLFEFYVKIIHEVIAEYLQQLLDNNQLKGGLFN
jgi:exocyst complex component 3